MKDIFIGSVALIAAAISIHLIVFLRTTDDELTFNNLLKQENIGITIALTLIVVMLMAVSGGYFKDEDDSD